MSDSEEESNELLAVLSYNYFFKKKSRLLWVHPQNQEREKEKLIQNLLENMKEDDFINYFGMKRSTFDDLLVLLYDKIRKFDTNFRKSIPPEEKLLVTLRYFVNCESYTFLQYQFRIGNTTISAFIPEVCEAIWEVLKTDYMKEYNTELWKEHAERFIELWQFPNCLGAINVKEIPIRRPYHAPLKNPKEHYTLPLQAVVDAEGCFIAIDIGKLGESNKHNIFETSDFGKKFRLHQLQTPSPEPKMNDSLSQLPYVFISDEDYPLETNLLHPYPDIDLTEEEKIFNYRLKRALLITDCAFEMLERRFKVVKKQISINPDKAAAIVKAVCVLHNFIQKKESSLSIRNVMIEMDEATVGEHGNEHCATKATFQVRKAFAEYFCSAVGALEWQHKYI